MHIKRVKFDNGVETTESREGSFGMSVEIHGAKRVSEQDLGNMSLERVRKLHDKLATDGKQKRLQKQKDGTMSKENKSQEAKDKK